MKIIGIIGTHGKTSVLYILEHLFLMCGNNVGIIGDLGIRINKNKIPDDTSIERLINKSNNIEYLFVELNEVTSEIDFEFDSLILTDLNDQMNSKEVKTLYRNLLRRSKEVIVNCDVEGCLHVIEGLDDLYVISYGLNNKSTVTASAISAVDEKMNFNYYLQRGFLSKSGNEIEVQEMPVEVNLIGYQNIYNSIAAITTSLIYDLNIDDIIGALKSIKPIPNRLELLKTSCFKIVLDMARDGYSFKMLLETLQYLNYDGLNIVISTENLENIIRVSGIEDFTEDLSLVSGSNIYMTGKPKGKILDEKKENILIDKLIDNRINLKYYQTPEEYLMKHLSKLNSDELLVWIGDKSSVEKFLKRD